MQHLQVTGLCRVASATPTAECVGRSTTGSRSLSTESKTEFCCIKGEGAPRRAGFWLLFLWGALPHPLLPCLSNTTSSKTIFGTQANHRQRKGKYEQELPLAHCQLGKQWVLQPPSHKDAFLHTPEFSSRAACKEPAGPTVWSADVSVSAGSGPVRLRPQLR